MAIIGFNFTKMIAEKKMPSKGKVDIKNDISIKNVESTELTLGETKNKALKFTFEFTSQYTPEIGNIAFNGEVLYMNETAKQDEILKSWKKNKEVPKPYVGEILNAVLLRSNVQALVLSREVNIPQPIPMPRVA